MKERPFQLNSSAVRSVLAGIKTQIRIPIRPQPAAAMEMLKIDFSPRGDFFLSEPSNANLGSSGKLCPLGRPGDLLWIREAYNYDGLPLHPEAVRYRADGQQGQKRWLRSTKMPRWASRILLEITEVHVERIQSISNADAVAEGHLVDDPRGRSPIAAFAFTWDSTYDKRHKRHSWSANPWVWAITFRRVQQTIVCLSPHESGLGSEV